MNPRIHNIAMKMGAAADEFGRSDGLYSRLPYVLATWHAPVLGSGDRGRRTSQGGVEVSNVGGRDFTVLSNGDSRMSHRFFALHACWKQGGPSSENRPAVLLFRSNTICRGLLDAGHPRVLCWMLGETRPKVGELSVITFECTVQEGCVSDELRPGLESAIEKVCDDVLGQDEGPVTVSWTVIPKGFGFRGGVPSTTSLVRGRIPDGCDRDTRSRILESIGDAWCRITGASQHELMVSARDWSWSG